MDDRNDKDGKRLPVRICKSCGNLNDAATPIESYERPTSGDVSVCFKCGHITMFTDNLTLRELTDEEMLEIAHEPRIQKLNVLRASYIRTLKTIDEANARDTRIKARFPNHIPTVNEREIIDAALKNLDTTLIRIWVPPKSR